MTDTPGQPPAQEDHDEQTEQTISLTTAQVAAQCGVHERTVRRWITPGLHLPGGAILRLQARAVNNGREYIVYQTELDRFQQERDRAAHEGQAAGQLTRAEESQ